MARRSPLNERYQKHTAPSGKTRKSAASAKPKRDTAGSGKSKPAAKKGSALLGNPDTPEFRRIRKLWWWLLGSSMIVTMLSLAVQEWTPYHSLARAMLGIGYTLIFYAIYLDWTKIRKMRKEWAASGGKPKKPAESDGKSDGSGKPDDGKSQSDRSRSDNKS